MDKHLIVYMNTLMRADKHSIWLHPEPQEFWKGGCSDERSLKQSSLDVLASIDWKWQEAFTYLFWLQWAYGRTDFK